MYDIPPILLPLCVNEETENSAGAPATISLSFGKYKTISADGGDCPTVVCDDGGVVVASPGGEEFILFSSPGY